MNFNELNLPYNILLAIKNMGFEEMTPIQEATYPIISAGQDLCAIAETGSGKTAACALPLIQKVDPTQNAIQGLVIVPTRELCIQYVDEIQRIAEKTRVVPFAVYGGFNKGIQVAKLKHKVHILVATPGRLIDLLYDGAVNLSQVKCAILDEADELLKVGFIEDIEFITSCILHDHQTLLFCATMAENIKKLANDCLRDPKHVSLIENRPVPVSIEHWFSYLHAKDKQGKLLDFLSGEEVKQAIIFCNARYMVDKLFLYLRKQFKGIDYIHAGLSQGKRSSIFWQFRNEKIRYLIASDVAGRGLDFSHVSHVINWDLPRGGEQYTHRTGRSGRMGRKGKAFTLVTKQDLPNLRKLISTQMINPGWIGRNPLRESDRYQKQENKAGKRPRRFLPRGKGKRFN